MVLLCKFPGSCCSSNPSEDPKVHLHSESCIASKCSSCTQALEKELEEGHEKEIGSKLQPSAQVASKRLRTELEETKCKGHEIDDLRVEETTLDSGEDDSEG